MDFKACERILFAKAINYPTNKRNAVRTKISSKIVENNSQALQGTKREQSTKAKIKRYKAFFLPE